MSLTSCCREQNGFAVVSFLCIVSVSRSRLQRAARCRWAGHWQHATQSEGLLSGRSLQTHPHQTHWCQLVSCSSSEFIWNIMLTAIVHDCSVTFQSWFVVFVAVVCREVIHYDDPRISLVHSDFEKLENKPAPVFNKGKFIFIPIWKSSQSKMWFIVGSVKPWVCTCVVILMCIHKLTITTSFPTYTQS